MYSNVIAVFNDDARVEAEADVTGGMWVRFIDTRFANATVNIPVAKAHALVDALTAALATVSQDRRGAGK